ncbi:MAG: hypothetical protein CR972_01835 [Candidatus Moraniibacteriota bacterium]|nr:MAG: hypothetical protein CR972_01835 [Candidatus Moranbacteria bacterium]
MDIIRNKKALRKHQQRRYFQQRKQPMMDNGPEIELLNDYVNRTRKPGHGHTINIPKKRGGKIFWIALLSFIISICIAGYAFYKEADNALEKISIGTEEHSVFKTISNIANPHSYEKLDGFTDGRINILLLGRANSHKSGKDLTDTIIVASINTKDYTVGLFSIPRDLLVTNGNYYVKINSRYQTGLRQKRGAQYIIDTIEDITAQKIHYYIVMDFEGFINVIDTLGGINVDVPHHIIDTKYPGPGYSYETFEVYPGLQKFDGTTALKYARTRHDVEGDFGRAKRQQQVMQAARNKAFSLGTIINPLKIAEIFTTLGNHIHTDITPNEIEPFITLMKKVDTHNINNVVVDAWKPNSLLISARYYSDHGGISGLVPRIGNYREIREHAENLFNLNKIAQREKDIKNESPTTITLINASDDRAITGHVRNMLHMIGFNNIFIKYEKDLTAENTTVIDTTGGNKPFSLDEILKKLPAIKSHSQETDYNTDFVIILGNDIVDTYTYTEISQEELEKENAKNNDK